MTNYEFMNACEGLPFKGVARNTAFNQNWLNQEPAVKSWAETDSNWLRFEFDPEAEIPTVPQTGIFFEAEAYSAATSAGRLKLNDTVRWNDPHGSSIVGVVVAIDGEVIDVTTPYGQTVKAAAEHVSVMHHQRLTADASGMRWEGRTL